MDLKSEIERLESEWKNLQQRFQTFTDNKSKVTTVHEMRKKILRDRMQDCKNADLNPDTLEEDMRAACQVIDIKMENFKADLTAQEEILAPLLREIA